MFKWKHYVNGEGWFIIRERPILKVIVMPLQHKALSTNLSMNYDHVFIEFLKGWSPQDASKLTYEGVMHLTTYKNQALVQEYHFVYSPHLPFGDFRSTIIHYLCSYSCSRYSSVYNTTKHKASPITLYVGLAHVHCLHLCICKEKNCTVFKTDGKDMMWLMFVLVRSTQNKLKKRDRGQWRSWPLYPTASAQSSFTSLMDASCVLFCLFTDFSPMSVSRMKTLNIRKSILHDFTLGNLCEVMKSLLPLVNYCTALPCTFCSCLHIFTLFCNLSCSGLKFCVVSCTSSTIVWEEHCFILLRTFCILLAQKHKTMLQNTMQQNPQKSS